MQSRFLVCVALAGFAIATGRSDVALAADAKAKAGKKKDDQSSEDKTGIGKTLQWEDKVMGPDDKKSELDKIRKAQEINKAAAEKAERDKAANAAREAKEKEAAAKAGPTTQKRGGDVALPTLPDEGAQGKAKPQHTEVSPKLETEAAKAPPPVLKPADDKFIDKLLKEEGGPKKKRASSTEDKALVDMLAGEKLPKGKKGKKDGVDDLLTDAEKAAPMPETKVKHETPEWAKPEIRESAPAPKVVAAPPKDKPNDGIIRVVQGAAGTSSGSARPAVATTTRTPPPPAGAGVRKQTAAVNSKPGEWADPFSDPTSRKSAGSAKTVAAKRPSYDDDDIKPAPRKTAAAAPAPKPNRSAGGAWDDPFSDGDHKTTGTRRAATPEPSKPAKAAPPARRGGGGKWDDPFTSDEAPAAKPARAMVATREPAAKKKVAAAPAPAPKAAAASADDGESPKAQGRWGILKKRR
jgi:hypothetical protein